MLALFVISAGATSANAQQFQDMKAYTTVTQEHVSELAARNIIKGTSPSTFSPNANITRGQVVKMMGRYVEESGLVEVPANWEQGDRFTDVLRETPDRELRKYSALLRDMGVFEGQRGHLRPNEPMTRENMALVLERLVFRLRHTSLTDYAYDQPSNVTDLANAKVEAKPYIEALNALHISTVPEFKPKATVKRVHFASFLMKTIELIDKERQVLYFERTAEELGFSRIDRVKTKEGSRYTVTFDEQSIFLYTKFDGDEHINEEILITGTNLFGRPHESSMRLVNMFGIKLSTIPEDTSRWGRSVSSTLFLMNTYTDRVNRDTKAGIEYVLSTPYLDAEGVYIDFSPHQNTPIYEDTFTGNTIKLVDGEIVRTPKTETYRYYFDYEGVLITDNTAKNYILDKRYGVTSDGEVTFNGKVMTDRELYYLPTVRPVPFVNWNGFFGGFPFPEEATLEEILKFHQTDGKKSSIPKTFMHPIVLVIDGDKNIYGTIDLRDATFGTFVEKRQ